jgi:hypothetical protein
VHEGCLTKRRSLWRFERLSRRKVRRLADNCLLLSRTHPDQIADYDQASGNAYTGLQWSTGLQTPNRLDQLQPCPHRSLGVILVGLGHPMVYCEKCLHHAPMALVPLMIRWGADTSSDRQRQLPAAPNAATGERLCNIRGGQARTSAFSRSHYLHLIPEAFASSRFCWPDDSAQWP